MRTLRNRDPNAVHLITNRTVDARMFMVPKPKIVEIIGGVVGKYQQIHDVKIFGLKFLSNHNHIIASQSEGNLWKFMADVNREIAKRLNRYLKREGDLWARRYSDQIVLEDSDQLKALAYVNTNAVHHGLVENPEDWPGLSSYNCQNKKFPFLNYTAYHLAKMRDPKVRKEDYTSFHEIEITELPCFASNTEKEIEALKSKEITERLEEIWEKNKNGYLGVKRILSQTLGEKPSKVKKSPKPAFYSKCGLAILRENKAYKLLVESYRTASEKFRLGNYDVEFPQFTFKPPLHYEPVVS